MKRAASFVSPCLRLFSARTREGALRRTVAALLLASACADSPADTYDAGGAPSTTGSDGGGSVNSGGGDGGTNNPNNSGSGASDAGGSSNNSSNNSGSDGGTSRMDGGSTSTPTGDASVPPGGGGCALKPNKDGWIANASNGAHVQGAVYTYASTGSTIMPLTSMTMPFSTGAEGKLCVKGEAAKVLNMDYSMYFGAALAFDLCQADPMSPTKSPIGQCPLGKGLGGIRFKLTGTTIPSQLRVQFHEAMRDQSTYVLAQAGMNEALFKDGKVIYDTMAPPVNVDKIDSIHFAIPTNDLGTTAFDFCVEDIQFVMTTGSCVGSSTSGDGGTTTTSDGGTTDAGSGTPDSGTIAGACSKSNAWTTSDKFGERNYGKYVVRNNRWNDSAPGLGSQTLWGNSERCWGVDATHSDPGNSGQVKGYPNVTRGWAIGTPGFKNSQHGLAIQVSALTKAKGRWRMQAPTSGRTWGLWDIYFHESANPSGDKAPVNLMIQQRIVDSTRWMQQDSDGWPKVTIAGITFREKRETGSTASSTRNRIQLYVDVVSGDVLGRDDLTVDIKAIVDHYVQQNIIRSSDYLTSIQAGFEIVAGGTYQTSEFWTAVQGEADGP